MTSSGWISDSLGPDRVKKAWTEASRKRLYKSLGLSEDGRLADDDLRFTAAALELQVFDLLEETDGHDDLCRAAAEAFHIARSLSWPADPLCAGEWLVRLGCLSVLGDRAADFRRALANSDLPPLPTESESWDVRVWASILEVWLRLLRKQGWDDLDQVQERVAALRRDQREREPEILRRAEQARDTSVAWELITSYHLAKAVEVLGVYLSQGSSDGHFDVRQQLEAQFDRAIHAAGLGQLMNQESMSRLLARTSQKLVDNSIWTVTRAVNSRVTKFVQTLTARTNPRPIFEMLPPQRKALREEGLLGSGHRSVVVSLPTSAGKTIIAEFRILQALNQFDQERGWVAYLAPTRALVNQLTTRLRRDFGPLGINVEKVSPALEIDAMEAGLLYDEDPAQQFRLLVSTPEKLDLLIRGGWEQEIGRPLTLVVVDEAHNLASGSRGLKLELLLATINRECRYAQFLLLTPFIRNAGELARWLSPDSHKDIELSLDWSPNDRAIVIAQPQPGEAPRSFHVAFTTQLTSSSTLNVPETLNLPQKSPLGFTFSAVSHNLGKLAAATAQALQARGTIIVLAARPDHSWGIASKFRTEANRLQAASEDLKHIQQFLAMEMGSAFPLAELLEYGVGVHHGGLSDDTKALIEWLAETGQLRVLVATTTIAQGVNFPVAGVVLASHQYPFGQDMPPEDFWNLAGRAGRVDQGDLGIVALAATTSEKAETLKQFIHRNVGELNSTLIDMVQRSQGDGRLLQLETLSWQPEWSAFLQYIAHTYRQVGDHGRFAEQVEQVLRGTLGFQALRRSHRGWADQLVRGVYNYADRIRGKSLKLVDSTGFSWESVSATLVRLREERITADVWTPELFGKDRESLRRMMGVLLQVPELREQLAEVTGGSQPNGSTLSRMICDWVQGRSLEDMAAEYFSSERKPDVAAMTRCCKSVFGRLTQTASWGLAALQSLTLADVFESLSEGERRAIRNLPAKVYYGVSSDEAVALRLLGVPRMAAGPLAQKLGVRADEPLSGVRARVRGAAPEVWQEALGRFGASFRRVWRIIEGEQP
jgi:DEAD/DEAH box helicase/Helicase conserved C-terminal domain